VNHATRQAAAQAQMLFQHLRALDLAPPPTLVDRLAELDRWADVDAALVHDPRALATAVADAIAAGKDPATDKQVTALLARSALASAQVGPVVAEVAGERRLAALDTAADEVVGLLAEEVARLDGVLRAAREVVGARLSRALADPATAASTLPAPHLSAWGQARDALGRLSVVTKAWRQLGQCTGRANVPARTADLVLIVAAPDAATLSRVVADHGTTEQAAALGGLDLSLATFAEYHERLANIAKQRQAAKQHDAADAKAQQRRANPRSHAA
jgi:hypothetical protein